MVDHVVNGYLTAAADEAVTSLEKTLVPAPAPDEKLIKRLIKDLDSDRFQTREAATTKLLALENSLPILHQALAAKNSLEVHLRLQRLIDQLEDFPGSQTRLQQYRAIQVLEYVSTEAAQRLLKGLAGGAAGTLVTREAGAALQRLTKRAS